MSHYDVGPVPNNTLDRWDHPPFEAYNDGEWVWGRGVADDKTLLVAQCEMDSQIRLTYRGGHNPSP